ncbi:MAG: septum formation initiator family protein [Zetaproteobacteria bacterium]|nr:septum formation initiator family protein [Zetaproteobacteria bacterium]
MLRAMQVVTRLSVNRDWIRGGLFYTLPFLMVGWMAYGLFVAKDEGYRAYRIEQLELITFQQDIDQLQQHRDALVDEILHVRNDAKTMENLIHRELGYLYPDEFMLIVPEQEGKQ